MQTQESRIQPRQRDVFRKRRNAFRQQRRLQTGGVYEAGLDNFLHEVKSIPGVRNAANFRHNITNRNGGTSDISWEGKDPSKNIDFTDLAAGYDFIETAGIEMKEGRSFSRNFGSEKSKIVFNEAAIATMGLKNPVGKTVRIWGEDREIIGVMKNFNFQSLHENLKPCFLDLLVNQRASKVMVKLEAGREKETLQKLEALYKKYNPGFDFNYRFLDQDYQALYSSEARVAGLSAYFAVIAIVISCLGLFGLAAFTAQKRQKEMGIRKVVGAGATQIALLLCRDFVKPVVIAMLIAFPLATIGMRQWLAGFAYRVSMGADTFVWAGLSIVLITLVTVSYQSVNSALENPVKSLRSELISRKDLKFSKTLRLCVKFAICIDRDIQYCPPIAFACLNRFLFASVLFHCKHNAR